MAKKIKVILKIQIKGGAATPVPPVGTVLGPHGVNLQDFCSKFNEQTRSRAAKIQKGSAKSLKESAGTITPAQVRQIAETKLPDLNTTDVEAAMRTVEGTARQMGIKIN